MKQHKWNVMKKIRLQQRQEDGQNGFMSFILSLRVSRVRILTEGNIRE